MTKKDGLFVRINYKNLKKSQSNSSRNVIGATDSTIETKFLYCAGVINKNGGTMIFRAKDMDEADYIANNNPFVHSDIYKYEIFQNNVIAL